jgi:hypothetical protein
MKGYAYKINVYLGKNQNTKDAEKIINPLINHQTAPKSWVCEDAVIVLTNIY